MLQGTVKQQGAVGSSGASETRDDDDDDDDDDGGDDGCDDDDDDVVNCQNGTLNLEITCTMKTPLHNRTCQSQLLCTPQCLRRGL